MISFVHVLRCYELVGMFTALLATLMCLNESTLRVRCEQRLWEPASRVGMILK